MLCLVILEVLLDSAEFLLDYYETIIDKGCRIACRPVLVLDPLLFLYVNESAEDVVCPRREAVCQCQYEDRGLFS